MFKKALISHILKGKKYNIAVTKNNGTTFDIINVSQMEGVVISVLPDETLRISADKDNCKKARISDDISEPLVYVDWNDVRWKKERKGLINDCIFVHPEAKNEELEVKNNA